MTATMIESRGRPSGRVTLELRTDGRAGANSLGVWGVRVPAKEMYKGPPGWEYARGSGRRKVGLHGAW